MSRLCTYTLPQIVLRFRLLCIVLTGMTPSTRPGFMVRFHGPFETAGWLNRDTQTYRQTKLFALT